MRREHMQFWFEHWPIFNKPEFEEFKREVFTKLVNFELDPKVDIRIIGSDKKMIKDHIEASEINRYQYNPQMDRSWNFKDNPLIRSYHYPELHRKYQHKITSGIQSDGSNVEPHSHPISLQTQNPPFFSFYQGDFETVAGEILNWYGSFKDFNIITNVPYGKQVLHPKRAKSWNRLKEKGRVSEGPEYKQIQDTFRRFGRMWQAIGDEVNNNIYVVSRQMRYSNPLSFLRLSNCTWDPKLDFTNGGINVSLLKFNPERIDKNRRAIEETLKISQEEHELLN